MIYALAGIAFLPSIHTWFSSRNIGIGCSPHATSSGWKRSCARCAPTSNANWSSSTAKAVTSTCSSISPRKLPCRNWSTPSRGFRLGGCGKSSPNSSSTTGRHNACGRVPTSRALSVVLHCRSCASTSNSRTVPPRARSGFASPPAWTFTPTLKGGAPAHIPVADGLGVVGGAASGLLHRQCL